MGHIPNCVSQISQLPHVHILNTITSSWDLSDYLPHFDLEMLRAGKRYPAGVLSHARKMCKVAYNPLRPDLHGLPGLINYASQLPVTTDEALKYAPNWKQLREAREAAEKQKS